MPAAARDVLDVLIRLGWEAEWEVEVPLLLHPDSVTAAAAAMAPAIE